MKRGDAAREAIKSTIIAAFGADYIATVDKKIYVEAADGPNGERIQFAIAMTMPKNPVAREAAAPQATNDWSGPTVATTPTSSEISDEDKKKVAELMEMLNIT